METLAGLVLLIVARMEQGMAGNRQQKFCKSFGPPRNQFQTY